MKRTTVLLDRDEEMLADLCKLRNTNNESAIIREALLVLWQKNFGQTIGNPITTSIAAPAPAPVAVSAPPRQVCLERVAVVTLGLESDLAPLEGIEARLTAAGWKSLRWQSGTLFGRHPDYKEIELPLGAQVER